VVSLEELQSFLDQNLDKEARNQLKEAWAKLNKIYKPKPSSARKKYLEPVVPPHVIENLEALSGSQEVYKELGNCACTLFANGFSVDDARDIIEKYYGVLSSSYTQKGGKLDGWYKWKTWKTWTPYYKNCC